MQRKWRLPTVGIFDPLLDTGAHDFALNCRGADRVHYRDVFFVSLKPKVLKHETPFIAERARESVSGLNGSSSLVDWRTSEFPN